MKVLLVLSNFPDERGEAIEVVTHEVVRLLLGAGHAVDAQVIIREPRPQPGAGRTGRSPSDFQGPFRLLEPVYLPEWTPAPSRWMRRWFSVWDLVMSLPFLRRRINPRLFPATALGPEMERRARESRPDVVLSVWSWEALAATHSLKEAPMFAYYGNPDHKPYEARLARPDLFNIPTTGWRNRLSLWKQRLLAKAMEVQHLRMMRRCRATANNSLVDAEYYSRRGHPKSLYLQNMWPAAASAPVFGGKPSEAPPFKVVASVGNLGATGNTFGLYCLGRELAPRLERMFGERGLALEVLGGGTPAPMVKQVLSRPSIRLRGWVEDIEAEILGSYAFLVLTNVDGFLVGNTRILLAWSLGACLVAHRNSALSMPEIVHGENALLGETPDELAACVKRAIEDRGLRERVGRGGYETYRRLYSSEVVMPKMIRELESLAGLAASRVESRTLSRVRG